VQTSFSDSGSDNTVVENTTPKSSGVISVQDSEDFEAQANSTMSEEHEANNSMEGGENNDPEVMRAQNEEFAGAHVNLPPPQIPISPNGMDPMAVVMTMMQQMQAQSQQMQAQNHQWQMQASRQQAETLQQMQSRFDAELRAVRREQQPQASTSVRAPYSGKPPVFDLEAEKHKFPMWKIRWDSFQVTSGLENIADEAVRQKAKRPALAQALSDSTLCWIDNLDVTPEEALNADIIIARLEAYIKGVTNPLVNVVQLLGRRKGTLEPYEKFFLDIKECAKLCNFEDIDDVRDWFLKSCVCSNICDTETQKKLLLERGLSFEKAMDICLQDEKAARTTNELSQTPCIDESN
jgi:hypothetical protein